MADLSELAEPDRRNGAPHPRLARQVFGHGRAEATFLSAVASGRLHHAWLLAGPEGIGKATLAWRIVRFLLAMPAEERDGLFGAPATPDSLDIAADHPASGPIAALSHPGLYLLRRGPNDKGDRLAGVITAEEVRKMGGFFALTIPDGGRRVVVVDAADEMNPTAANALLKMLEEPPARTTFLMVAHSPARLLPTIRSRTRMLRLSPLAPDDMARALGQAGQPPEAPEALAALAGGAPGRAIDLIAQDGLARYAELVQLLDDAPGLDRNAAIALAARAAPSRGGVEPFALVLQLIEALLTRAARAGVAGPPQVQIAAGEARLLARLSPHDHAARAWAGLAQMQLATARAGHAVNLDPTALIIDTLLAIDRQAAEILGPALPRRA